MNRLVLALVLVPLSSFAQPYLYDQPAKISGKILIIKSLHPNPEFYGEKQPAVSLAQQIIVDGDEGRVQTKLIQLIDNDTKRYGRLLKSNGLPVSVNCKSLFRAMTGHHTTKVLCDVDSITFG